MFLVTRPREVTRAHQGLGAHHLELCVGDVRLGVEFVLVVDAALDLTGTERIHNGVDPAQERVVALVLFETGVKPLKRLFADRFEEHLTACGGWSRSP